jgi:hypothetical protein
MQLICTCCAHRDLAEVLHLVIQACLQGHAVLQGCIGSPSYSRCVCPALRKAAKMLCLAAVGITDDVSFSSLSLGPEISTLPPCTKQCVFWGMGADGTVGANHEAVRIIAEQPGVYAQAYFSFDAHKSGGVTVSHLRFGPSPINSAYLVSEASEAGVGLGGLWCHLPYGHGSLLLCRARAEFLDFN